MAEWRFRFTPCMIPHHFLESAYFAGWGRVPTLTQTRVQGNQLIVRSEYSGGGTVHVPMPQSLLGMVMESTESLLSRHEPYYLLKELARGSLGRFCRRLFDWQVLGFSQPKHLEYQLQRIVKRFAHIITKDPKISETEKEFATILNELVLLNISESKEFAEQSISWHTKNHESLSAVFGIGMPAAYFESLNNFNSCMLPLCEAFQVVLSTPSWRELEPQPGQFDWERLEKHIITPYRFGFQTVIGPLISFHADAIPEWVLSNIGDKDYFMLRAAQFVNAVAERYGHIAHAWILADQFMNQSLLVSQQGYVVAFICIIAQQLRSRGINTPIVACIDQPWEEYALRKTPEWKQVQTAEILMNCREIDSFLLKMEFGCRENQTLPRDPMSVGSMVDQWSFLGKKVYISLSVPSAGSFITAIDLPTDFQWSEEHQRFWTEILLLTLLSKKAVKGVFWSHFQDSPTTLDSASTKPGQTTLMSCYSGLLTSQQTIKPAYKFFAAARRNLMH